MVREYQGERHEVMVAADGFIWREKTYASLSMIAREITGTSWNGPRFFGVQLADHSKDESKIAPSTDTAATSKTQPKVRHRRH